MINYQFTNSIDFDFNIESKFTYNFYNKKEKYLDDNLIDNVINKSPYSYIEIDIDLQCRYDNRLEKYKDNILSFNDLIEKLKDKSLNKEEINLFNKINNHNNNLISSSFDLKNKELKDVKNHYNLSSVSYNNLIPQININQVDKFFNINKKIHINNQLLNEFNACNNNNEFITTNIKNNISKTKKIFKKNENLALDNTNNIEIFENFTPIKTSLVTRFDSKSYYFCVGVLIEKYCIEDDSFIKKDSRFYSLNQESRITQSFRNDNSLNFTLITSNLSIWDGAIKYGKEYFYACYPVYIATIPKKDDYYLLESFLVCDYPHFTPNIICKEFKRPTSPSALSFRFKEEENSLLLEWPIPYEEQGDIKGYQIFKRNSLSEPYTLIGQIDFFDQESFYEVNENITNSLIKKYKIHTTEFVDEDFDKNKIEIYTLCSIDARGYTSNYGDQLAVYYDKFNKELIIDSISDAGAPLHMPNLLMPRKTKFFDNDDKIFDNTPFQNKVSKITLYATPECGKIFLDDSTGENKILNNKYKFNIFKVESSENILKDVEILNFDNN